jgi:hypothetical protein
MTEKRHILFAAGIVLLSLTLSARAQQEQWLRYHSAREVSVLGTASFSQSLELSSEKPAGMKLPQFKSDKPYFAKWPTPMVKEGYLRIACDRSHKHGPYDLLYIDSNHDGQLDDETVATAYRTDQYSAYFGPVKVIFEIEDGPVTYHLNLRFYGYEDRETRLYISSGGWYEGDISVAGEKKRCVLFDYNVNGTFDDKSVNSAQCDRIRIGAESIEGISFVGKYIDIDNVLYQPEIARDGAYVKLVKAENVQTGNVQMPEGITQFSAGGENGLFILKPEKGLASLPVGQYRMNDWTIEREDEQGVLWKLKGTGSPGSGPLFDVASDKATELSIGEPVVSSLNTSSREGTHTFRYEMAGRDGERIELTRNGARPQAPKLHVKNKDGTYDRTYSFQYG